VQNLVRMASEDERSKRRGKPPEDPNTKGQGLPPSRGFLGLVSIGILGLLLFMMFINPGRGEKVSLEQFSVLYKDKQIKDGTVIVRDDAVTATRVPGPDVNAETQIYIPLNLTSREHVSAKVYEITGDTAESRPASPWSQVIIFFGPVLLMILLIYFLISRGLRGAGGGGGMLGNFGKSRHRTLNKEMTGVTFTPASTRPRTRSPRSSSS